ncbi:hypothetical protein NPIL_321121 [Nephila pilipes]|uniref:Uncharacterized protein n=1 Tax=Nephila pilipes TaxID=299642 RepID=A0A8X6MQR7_NEPPI|nr:hypothetical protein NPIL_321121 [Nephila pilipes]
MTPREDQLDHLAFAKALQYYCEDKKWSLILLLMIMEFLISLSVLYVFNLVCSLFNYHAVMYFVICVLKV